MRIKKGANGRNRKETLQKNGKVTPRERERKRERERERDRL